MWWAWVTLAVADPVPVRTDALPDASGVEHVGEQTYVLSGGALVLLDAEGTHLHAWRLPDGDVEGLHVEGDRLYVLDEGGRLLMGDLPTTEVDAWDPLVLDLARVLQRDREPKCNKRAKPDQGLKGLAVTGTTVWIGSETGHLFAYDSPEEQLLLAGCLANRQVVGIDVVQGRLFLLGSNPRGRADRYAIGEAAVGTFQPSWTPVPGVYEGDGLEGLDVGPCVDGQRAVLLVHDDGAAPMLSWSLACE